MILLFSSVFNQKHSHFYSKMKKKNFMNFLNIRYKSIYHYINLTKPFPEKVIAV